MAVVQYTYTHKQYVQETTQDAMKLVWQNTCLEDERSVALVLGRMALFSSDGTQTTGKKILWIKHFQTALNNSLRWLNYFVVIKAPPHKKQCWWVIPTQWPVIWRCKQWEGQNWFSLIQFYESSPYIRYRYWNVLQNHNFCIVFCSGFVVSLLCLLCDT
jgi:glycosyltransferase involved in cell wall biosynthesis